MQKHLFRIVYLIVAICSAIYCSNIYASDALRSCPPNEVTHHILNNVQKISTDYEDLKKVDVTKLSPNAKQQLLNTIAVYDRCDKESKMKFVAEFPNTFKKFLDIFQGDDLQLQRFPQFYYAIGASFNVLGFIAEEYPDKSVDLLVSLSSEAKYDADAPWALHDIFIKFFIKHPDLTIPKIKQLNISKQKNIATFLADVEAIRTDQDYQSVLDILKNRNEKKLYNMFLEAKRIKIVELKHEHM